MPTLYITTNADTFVYERYPRNNYVSRNFMSSGQSACGYIGYSLLNFPAQNILPVGSTILSAELRLWLVTAIANTLSPIYGVHRIQSRWSAPSVTWCTRPLFNAAPVVTFASPALGLLVVNITNLIDQWVSGESAELGLLIKNDEPFNAETYIQAASVNTKNSDIWPRIKIEYSVPAVSIGSITPQFVDDLVNLPVPASGTAEHEKNVSLLGLVTVFVTNNGPGSVDVSLQLSPDGSNFITEGPVVSVAAGVTEALVSGVFSHFLKVVAQNTDGLSATLEIRYQGQIG